MNSKHKIRNRPHLTKPNDFFDPKKLKLGENLMSDFVPANFLNSLGFIKYDEKGDVPWTNNNDSLQIFIPPKYESITNFLAIDCRMVGVGHLKVNALGRVSIVNEYGYCIYDTFVNPIVDVTDYRTEVSGVRVADVENAPPVNIIQKKVADLVKGKTLVGHSIHNTLNILKLSGHVAVRDTALFFKKFNNTKTTQCLSTLIAHNFQMFYNPEEKNSILNAQANMKLYLLHRKQWEKDFSEWRVKANIVDETILVTEITDMHVEPRETDLFVDSKTVFVRPNKILGAYSSSEEYLDVHFRLLLEDFMRPLRETVQDINEGKAPMSSKDEVLSSVRLQGKFLSEVKGNGTVVVPIEINNIKNWDEAGMFMNGSLLLLSHDNFKSVKFAVIGTTRMKGENSYNLPIQVTFSQEGPSWVVRDSDRFSMIESKALYAAYKHTLEFIQTVNLDKFPMKKYLVDVVTKSVATPYLLKEYNRTIDFSVLMKDGSSQKAKPLEFHTWPKFSDLGLDSSQYEALQKALTQELTIIQGPPGTGKTFTTLQLIKMLLTNEWLRQDSPILVVAYTNHALDQVLELILDFITTVLCKGNEKAAHQKILRLGGGSKSEKVEPLTMLYKDKKAREKSSLKFDIKNQQKLLKNLSGLNFQNYLLDSGIFNFNHLTGDILYRLGSHTTCADILSDWIAAEYEIYTLRWFGITRDFLNNPKKSPGLFVLRCDLQTMLSKDLPQIMKMVDQNILVSKDVYISRWAQYFFVLNKLSIIVEDVRKTMSHLQQQYEEVKDFENVRQTFRGTKVIAMTTTAAAKNKELIQDELKPKIMIVEEAAQILEAHVLACLTKHCQQMIMIGDHQQLRPLTADNDLGENYQLNVSMMERLIENGKAQNAKNWIQLKQQHRMKPEIAKMICPIIYKDLQNHPKVLSFPPVNGCDKSLFFVDHKNTDKKERGSCSFYNDWEARYIIEMLLHFIPGGFYEPKKITVIATYLAQKHMLQDMIRNNPQLKEVTVSTVDGYQGEENDIVFLSLVRSNPERQVGFLKTDNRVCVALSRARYGFFMVGNMSCLKSASDLWYKINKILEESKCIGNKLPLNMNCEVVTEATQLQINLDNLKTLSTSDLEAGKENEDINGETQGKRNHPLTAFPVFSENLSGPFRRIPLMLPNPNYMSLDKKIDCVATVTKNLPCGHVVTMQCCQFSSGEGGKEPARVQPCQHEHDLSKYKCTVNVMTDLPCGHWQSTFCHESPSCVKCDSCTAEITVD